MNIRSSFATITFSIFGLSATALLSGCSSSQTKWENHQSAAEQQLDQHLYNLYNSNCKKGLVELSWIEKRGELTEKAYQQCLTQFRSDMNEESFHTAVVQQLHDSNIWFESAVWLQQKGLFTPIAKQQCQAKANSIDEFLYQPRVRYPVAAARDGVEGEIVVKASFDSQGFFKDVIELKSTPERVFDRTIMRNLPKTVICTTDGPREFQWTIGFKLQKKP